MRVVRGCVAMLIAVVALLMSAAVSARADGGIAFLDDGPVTVNLSAMEPNAHVTVVLVNPDIKNPISAKVTVASGTAGSLAVEPASRTITAGSESLPFTIDARKAHAGSAKLIAFASDGSVARVTVDVIGQPPPTPPVAVPSATGPALAVDGDVEITASRTSGVPSFFRPAPDAATWVGVAIALLAVTGLLFALRRRIAGSSTAASVAIGGLVVVSGVASVVLAGGAVVGFAEHKPARAASASWRVSPPPTVYTQGSLTDGSGAIGSLAVNPAGVRAGGMDRAGTFTGSVDATPGTDGGNVKVTVHVRDWWGYAVVAIAIGLGVASLIGFLVGERRAKRELELAGNRIRRDIAARQSSWEAQTTGTSWAASFDLGALQGAVAANASQKVADNDVDAAQKLQDALSGYAVEFEAMRWRANDLGRESDKLRGGVSDVGVKAGDPLPALKDALGPLDLAHEDVSEKGKLSARKEAIDAAFKLFGRLSDEVNAVLAIIRDNQQKTDPSAKDGLNAKLIGHLQEVVAATSTDYLDTLHADTTALKAEVDAAATVNTGAPGITLATPYASNPLLARITNYLANPARAIHPSPTPSLAAPSDADDLVTLSTTLTGAAATAGPYRWQFSDGTSSAATRGTPKVGTDGAATIELSIRHQFASGGDANGNANGKVLDKADKVVADVPVPVSRVGRAARAFAALRASDATLGVVAALLTAGSGMVALYLTNSTWGSSGDYITALLWGSAASEGVKAAAKLITRFSPTPQGG